MVKVTLHPILDTLRAQNKVYPFVKPNWLKKHWASTIA